LRVRYSKYFFHRLIYSIHESLLPQTHGRITHLIILIFREAKIPAAFFGQLTDLIDKDVQIFIFFLYVPAFELTKIIKI